ncbi:MAG: hypothetical protein IJ348_01975 [Alistipes sp.]|nr:hypothetical protein [Alistipes sp.]
MRYLVKSLKYFVALCVLCGALVWLNISTSGSGMLSTSEVISLYFSTWNGWAMVAAVVLLSATYPFFGFIRRYVDGDVVRNRQQVLAAMEMMGYSLVRECDGVLYFRANLLQRITTLFEDEIKVCQAGDKIELSGLRRAVVRTSIRLDGYIVNSAYTNE